MGKKNKGPLTTSFVRELSRKSPFEDLDFKLRSGGRETHWARMRTMDPEELLEEGKTYGGRLLAEVISTVYVTDLSYRSKFSAWFDAFIRRIGQTPVLKDDVITYACGVPVAAVIGMFDEHTKGLKGVGLTKEEKEAVAKVFMERLGLRAYTHRIHHKWVDTHRATYLYSPDLAEMLCHTRLDKLPVSSLRLPYPFVELCFPEKLFPPHPLPSYEETTSVFYSPIIGATLEEQTDIGAWRISVWGKNPEGEINLLHQYSLHVNTTQSITTELERALGNVDTENIARVPEETQTAIRENTAGINTFIAASIIYATMPNADVILGENSPEYAAWAKAMAARKLNRHQQKDVTGIRGTVERPNRYFLGRSVRIIDRHEPAGLSSPGETRASPRMHWRAGHFHLYWTGPKDGGPRNSVVKFVEPTIVNAPEGTTELDVSKAGMR